MCCTPPGSRMPGGDNRPNEAKGRNCVPDGEVPVWLDRQ